MLMSWNFSQCFYYRPPVLNIFQRNTPKFHCLQWINNTVLSLKYHAFFNQAPGLKQKLLERYFFMIRTIRNVAAIIKGCSQSHALIYTVYVSYRERNRETPGVDWLLVVAVWIIRLDWLTSVMTGDLRSLRPKAVKTTSTKEQNRSSLFRELKKCSPSCKRNIPKFSSPLHHTAESGFSSPLLVSLPVRTRCNFVLVLCIVWSPLSWSVLELTHISCRRLPPTWNPSWLFHSCQQEKRCEQPDCFISSSQIMILSYILFTALPPSASCVVIHRQCLHTWAPASRLRAQQPTPGIVGFCFVEGLCRIDWLSVSLEFVFHSLFCSVLQSTISVNQTSELSLFLSRS